MKKLILGLAVTAGTLAFAQQTPSSNPVTFGVKGGMNVSSLSKDNGLDDQKSKIGFNAGYLPTFRWQLHSASSRRYYTLSMVTNQTIL